MYLKNAEFNFLEEFVKSVSGDVCLDLYVKPRQFDKVKEVGTLQRVNKYGLTTIKM